MAGAFVVTWSSGFVGAIWAGDVAGPLTLLAWRYLITAAVLLGGCLLLPTPRNSLREMTGREFARQAVLGALSHVVFLGGVFLAAAAGLDAGVSALVCALQPMVVAAASAVLFADRLAGQQWMGLGIGITGVALSVGGADPSATSGIWLVVASLIALSSAALLERAWAPRTTVTASLAVQVAVAAVVFTAAAAATSGMRVDPSSALVGALVWLVLMSGLGGYATFIRCLRELGATPTSTLLYLTPPVTALWAWAMFSQQPDAGQWLGMATVLARVILTLGRNGALTSRHRDLGLRA